MNKILSTSYSLRQKIKEIIFDHLNGMLGTPASYPLIVSDLIKPCLSDQQKSLLDKEVFDEEIKCTCYL